MADRQDENTGMNEVSVVDSFGGQFRVQHSEVNVFRYITLRLERKCLLEQQQQ